MEGTQYEESEAIQKGNEELEADQGYGETCGENESGYQICASRQFASYPQQGSESAHS